MTQGRPSTEPAIRGPFYLDEEGVPRLRAYTVPIAPPAAAMAPILISKDRVWCCFAGAIARPAGFEAAPPTVLTRPAVAAPSGSSGVFFGCGFSCNVVWRWGVLSFCVAVFCSAPEASG